MAMFAPTSDGVSATTGVLNSGGAVSQTGTPSMAVSVTGAVFVIPGPSYASVGAYLWSPGTAATTVTIGGADPSNPRIDLVTVQVTTAGTSSTAGQGDFVVVPGTPASSPTAPSTPTGALVLAQVRVDAGVTSIVNAKITDQRTFTSMRSSTFVGSAQATSNQGSIAGSTVDLTSVTKTFTAVSGHRYKVIASGLGCTSTVTSDIYQVQLNVGGTTVQQARGACGSTPTASWFMSQVISGLSGSVTAKVQIIRAAGTGTLTHSAGSSNPATITVEDIGL